MRSRSPLYSIVWQEGKYYVSQCLNVDVSSFGKTRQEAIKNLNEAVDLYFEETDHVQHQVIRNPEIVSLPRDNA